MPSHPADRDPHYVTEKPEGQMSQPLRVLLVEDVEEDALLMLRALRTGGFEPEHLRVDAAESMATALASGSWDIVLSDYTMPQFSALDALALLQKNGLDAPFIVVTGTIGEVEAVRCLHAGAADYLLKDRLDRLPSAVKGALAAAGEHRRRLEAEHKLAASERRLRAIIEAEPQCVKVLSPDGLLLEMNPAGLRMIEADSLEQVAGHSIFGLILPGHRAAFAGLSERVLRGQSGELEFEIEGMKGGRRWLETRAVPLRDEAGRVNALLGVTRDITERKYAGEALDRERALLRTLIDLLPDYIYIKDDQSRFLLANRAVAQAMGVAQPESLIGKSDQDFYPPAEAAIFESDERNVLAGRALFNKEEVAPHFDGTQRIILTTKVPLTDAAGNIIGLVGIGRDITERKWEQAAVQSSQRMLQLVLDNVPQAVFWKDRDSRYLGCNAILARHRGVENAEALVGKSDRDFGSLTPEQAEAFLRSDREIMATDQPQLGIIEQTTRADGALRWLETNKVPLHDTAGNVIGVLGTWQDITARKEADEEIRRLAAFPQMNPNPVLELTAEGAIQFHNAAAAAMAVELGFAHPVEMLPPGAADIVGECLATGKSRVRLEMPCGNRIVSWSFYPIPDRGIVHCYAGDVTEPRQLAEQLRQVQKMESIGQLAAGIAHDFNNLLTVIQGYSDILRLELADRPQSLEAVKQIAAAGERAAGLTRQLLLFSRKQLAQRRLLDLNELTGNMTKMLVRVLGEDIALRLDCRPSLPPVSADPGMIEQVIANLALNARDAMPEGGRLEIATSVVELAAARVSSNPEAQPGRYVCLTVSDTGSGIAPEIQSRIFEPFFTTKEPGKGTGLGLATVYGVVMQHQGVVEVASQQGAGTRFHIFLPAASRAEEVASTAVAPAPSQGGSETILLVEDEAAMRPLLEKILKQAGYTVLTAISGAAALRMWPEHREKIDLLLTDLVMPEGVSGKQLTESLKREKPGLRVIFMSGYNPEIRGGTRGIEEGLNYLQKPFSNAALLQAVRWQLDERG